MAQLDNPVMITDTDISGVLKRVFEKFRVNTFPIATALLAQLKKGKAGGPQKMKWGGDGVYWDVVLTRPVGFTANQAGYFGHNAKAVEKQANVGIKRTYVTRQIDALAAMGTESREAAYISLGRKIVQEALSAAKLGQQEVLHGDGRGVKALVASVGSATSITASDPYGLSGAGQGGLLLDIGMYVTVLDTSVADAILGTAEITNITNSGDTATITFGGAGIAGMAAGDKIVAAVNQSGESSYNAVPNGLINLLNYDGATYNSLHGITSATYARWDAVRMTAGTDTADVAQPTEMDVWELGAKIAGRSGADAKLNPEAFLLLTTPGLEKKLAESFLGQRRFDASSMMTIKGGFKALNINGSPLISDYWTPKGTVYQLHLPDLCWVDGLDFQKLQYEGAGPWRPIPGRDGYEVNFGSYWNTCALNRCSHGIIKGYTDAARYSHVV